MKALSKEKAQTSSRILTPKLIIFKNVCEIMDYMCNGKKAIVEFIFY